MRNVAYLGLCWASTLGLVAAVLADQPPSADGQFAPQWGQQSRQADSYQGNTQSDRRGSSARQPDAWPSDRGNLEQQGQLPAPQDRSLLGGTYSAGPSMADQPRGELGVWLVESPGPGVSIQRITRGSAAEQAGLRSGDVILQVNGHGASSPQGAAQLIRQIPIGDSGMLTIWRDGDQQQLQVTMQAARESGREMSRQISYGGEESSAPDWAARTVRLEQQINLLTQELHQLKQELAQLRSTGGAQPAVYKSEPNQSYAPPQPTQPSQPAEPPAAPAPSYNQTQAPPGFGATEEKSARPAEAAKSPTPAADAGKSPTPASEAPKAPAPAAEKDPFGTELAPAKSQEKPKSDKEPKSDSNDLF